MQIQKLMKAHSSQQKQRKFKLNELKLTMPKAGCALIGGTMAATGGVAPGAPGAPGAAPA